MMAAFAELRWRRRLLLSTFEKSGAKSVATVNPFVFWLLAPPFPNVD
jgi:hypothetical protein